MDQHSKLGYREGLVSVILNLLLFVLKYYAGIASASLALIADAWHTLSDSLTSLVVILGIKLSSKKPDKEHPFGHGRIEYIAALIVSFLVLEVGFTFLKDSVSKIRTPETLNFRLISVVILILSIGVKLWLGVFNKKLGKKIDSKVMMAVFTDSMGDVITTSATILSLVIFRLTGLNIDGIVGIGVALVVMWAGVGIAKDTLEPLIGEAIDPEEYDKVKHFVERYQGIEGTHDLIIHNYGPNQSMASIHAEVPNDADIEEAHELIDRIERDAVDELGILLVIHMDPVDADNPMTARLKKMAEGIISGLDERLSLHDFRIVDAESQINIIFDLVVPREYTKSKQDELKQKIYQKIREQDSRYFCVITTECSFQQEKPGK